MVKATISLQPERHELETIPGGFVVLKHMSYGEWLKRRDLGMAMSVDGASIGKGAPDKVSIDMIQTAVTAYEFSVSVVDHNLDDENGIRLALGTVEGFSRLDPRIGQEISELIDTMNQWENPKSGESVSEGSGEVHLLSEDSSPFTGVTTDTGPGESMSDISGSS